MAKSYSARPGQVSRFMYNLGFLSRAKVRPASIAGYLSNRTSGYKVSAIDTSDHRKGSYVTCVLGSAHDRAPLEQREAHVTAALGTYKRYLEERYDVELVSYQFAPHGLKVTTKS